MRNIHTYGLLSVSMAFAFSVVTWLMKRKYSKKRIPKMKLYWFDNFRSKRCEWLLAELGGLGDVELISMNPQDPNQELLAEYQQIHPHGTIPCLEVEGRAPILESGAICLYLANIYNNLGPNLDKEAYYNWIVYSVSTLDEVMETIFVQWQFTELKDQDTELINKMVRKFQVFGNYLTKILLEQDYLCGDRLTAADCVLGYNLWWAYAMKNGALLSDFSVIQQYYDRLSRRSTFQRTFVEE